MRSDAFEQIKLILAKFSFYGGVFFGTLPLLVPQRNINIGTPNVWINVQYISFEVTRECSFTSEYNGTSRLQ